MRKASQIIIHLLVEREMENFCGLEGKKRILLCSNADYESAARLSERFVPQNPQIDAIIALGPFNCMNDVSYASTEEEEAGKIADIASIIAQLETIVCRVMYLPSQKDPNQIIVEEPHLTPNSLTIHGRKVLLLKDLFIAGFSEPDLTCDATEVNNEGDAVETMDEIRVQSARSIECLRDTINLEIPESQDALPLTGIFALLYSFSHTLNHFLFHLTNDLDSAGIQLCIINSANAEETSRLPKKFGNLSIVVPGNLQQGFFTLVDLELDNAAKQWKVISVDHQSLN